MIIQCLKCSTKYRFDDSLVEGRGVWVRCTRCRDVFFQENPFQADAELREASLAADELSAPLPQPEADRGEFDQTLELDTQKNGFDEFLAKVEETKKALAEQPEPEPLLNIEKESHPGEAPEPDGFEEGMKPVAVGEEKAEPVESSAERPVLKSEKRGFWSSWRIIALIVLINLIFGGLYVGLFPEARERVLQNLSSAVPALGNLFGTGEKPGEFHLNQVRFKELRQRYANNLTVGRLRVLEGLAVNSSPYPITRLQVRGELYDGNGVIITERLAYGGNLLSDDELAAFSEDALQKELDLPMGSDAQNIRIEPKGQIPFMILFIAEPPGVVKAKVSAAGGEKLQQ